MESVKLIDFAFMLGVIIQITKLGDLFFRQHQKKKIQSACETLALKLEYFKSDIFFDRFLYNKKVRILFVMLFSVIAMLFLIRYYPFNTLIKIAIVISNGIGYSFIIWVTMLEDITESKVSAMRNLMKYFGGLLVISCIVVVLFYLTTKDYIKYSVLALDFTYVLNLLLSITSYIIFLVIFFALLLTVQLLLKISTFVVWRIAEYNKGAIAAITLIVTVFLGILSLFYRVES